MGNERGYILPLAMILAASILLMSVSVSAIFVSRYSYLKTMEQGYKRESLIVDAVDRLLSLDQSVTGTFTYTEGIVRYEVQKDAEVTRLILTLETEDKNYTSVNVTFENDTKDILDWK
jgi:hypothetical protein